MTQERTIDNPAINITCAMRAWFLLLFLPFLCSAQSSKNIDDVVDTNIVSQAKQFVMELYEPGMEMTADSILLSREFNIMLGDSAYRAALFPETYTWLMAAQLLAQKRLKHAFWYLINLYPQSDSNKKLVLEVILTYDKVFEMDKIMTSTFYTYSFFDPRISAMIDGKPEIIHPEVLESMLNDVKSINRYIQYYREHPPD